MSKTPEEYFQEQEFQAEPAVQEELFTEAERAFIEKYVGLEEADILEKLGIDAPVETTAVPMPEPEPAPEPEPEYESEYEPEEEPEEELEEPVSEVVSGEDTTPESSLDTAPEEEVPLERKLQQQDELQLVSFFVGKYEYTMPIEAVQEVVRSIRPTQVPEAPEHLAGLVNLRGRVTPLVRLDELLGIERGSEERAREEAGEMVDKFIIVCRKKGLQVGLLVREVATMYRVSPSRIEWNIESKLGGNIEFVTALLRRDDEILVGILSIDKLVEQILQR